MNIFYFLILFTIFWITDKITYRHTRDRYADINPPIPLQRPQLWTMVDERLYRLLHISLVVPQRFPSFQSLCSGSISKICKIVSKSKSAAERLWLALDGIILELRCACLIIVMVPVMIIMRRKLNLIFVPTWGVEEGWKRQFLLFRLLLLYSWWEWFWQLK